MMTDYSSMKKAFGKTDGCVEKHKHQTKFIRLIQTKKT